MTAETLHDALTLLPADLIAQADRKRNRNPVRVHWQRWAAMAACLAVILGFGLLLRSRLLSGGSKSATNEMALQAVMDSSPPEEAAAAEAPATGATADNGSLKAAPTQAERRIQASSADTPHSIRYVNTPDNLYTTAATIHGPEITLVPSREALDAYLEEWETDYLLDELRTACEYYDNVWFEAHDLVLIPVWPVSAGSSVTVTEVTETENALEVHIAVSQPDADAECTTWHILLETEKGRISNAGAITVIYE